MTVQTRGTELIGRTLGGRYRLLALLGTGASAGVYLAEDANLARRVAVKVLHPGLAHDPAFQRRFRAEARAAASLSHPHVLAVHDWGEDDGAYLVSELLDGGSLRDLLDAGERLTLSQALVVGLQAAQGLDYAHRHGFVHRDVKPANLLFGRDGRLRIGDFGIARAVAEAAWTEPHGVLVGTARYAAPEQASPGPIDGRADVYALALTLIEAVTGEVPLLGDTPLATMARRQAEPVRAPGSLGPLAPLLEAAGAVDPAERPTAADTAEALLAAAGRLERPTPLPLPGLPPAALGRDVDLTDRPGGRSGEDDTELIGSPTDEPLPAPPVGGAPVASAPGPALFDLDVHADTGPGGGRVDGQPAMFDVGLVDPPGGASAAASAGSRRRRRRWPWLVAVLAVLVAAGGTLWQYQRTRIPTYPVGSYTGQSVGAVLADAEANGWLVDQRDERRDGTEPGEVLDQSPPPGVELEQGGALTLVVSEGQVLRPVPELADLALDEAEALLADRELAVGNVSPEHDEEAPIDQVLRPSVAPGEELETGSSVDLVVSAGPAPRTVPDVTGASPADAVAALEEVGLVADVAEEHHLQVPEGGIISVTPGPGTQLERGDTVGLVVSLGLPFIVVPDVVGMSAAEASDRLEAEGFEVVDTVGPPNRPVLITDPPAGERWRLGKAVTIVTRSS